MTFRACALTALAVVLLPGTAGAATVSVTEEALGTFPPHEQSTLVFEAAAGVILEWLARFRVDCVHVEGANLLSYDEHAGIARAIAARDPDAAAEAMTRHQQRSHALYRLLGAGSGDPGRPGPSPAARAWPKVG